MFLVVLNIMIIIALMVSSLVLAIKLHKNKDVSVSGENQVDQLYDIFIKKEFYISKALNVACLYGGLVLGIIELIIFQYHRFLQYDAGLKFMKTLFMNYYLDNRVEVGSYVIPMIISLIILFVAYLINLFWLIKVRHTFYGKVKEFMKKYIPPMYDHVHFKPLYVPRDGDLVLCQDRFNQFRFNQNKHTFDRYYKNVKYIDKRRF